jgi:DNA invertase Pin-like site-specific DNA recombinase
MSERYVVYRRVSTKEQGKSGLGLDAQSRDIRIYLEQYCKAPEVVAEFTEVESGGNSTRAELNSAIAMAKKEKAILLVAKLDRLSRDVGYIDSLIKDKKLDFKVASMPSADKFMLQIYAVLAEKERDFISQRTKAALGEAKARGVKLGGLRDKTMKRNIALKQNAQDRAERLRSLIEPMVNNATSLRDMAKALNEAGIETARGGTWGAVQVSRLVSRLA